MNKNKINLELDTNLNKLKSVTLKQYNKDSQWLVISVTENGKSFIFDENDICIFKMKTPDGREIYNDAVIADNTIIVEITQNCCICSGAGEAELNIIDEESGSQIATMNFYVTIEESVYDNEDIEGSAEFGALTNRIAEADAVIMEANNTVDDLQNKLNNNYFVLSKEITMYSNLNNYTIPGFYYCSNHYVSMSISNNPFPKKSTFFMIVGKHDSVYQEVIEYSSTPKRYMRNGLADGQWTDWIKIYSEIDPPTSINGNAATATKATQDGNGNIISDTYAKKSIYNDETVSVGRLSASTAGTNSFAFGNNVTASGRSSFSIGQYTTASGYNAYAEGWMTNSLGTYSHSEGQSTNMHTTAGVTTDMTYEQLLEKKSALSFGVAYGTSSHVEGDNCIAYGHASHAEGYNTAVSNYAGHASGKYNKSMISGGKQNNQIGDVFIIGNGTNLNSLSNAFRITYAGEVYGNSAFNSSGADYAEFLKPWWDNNEEAEDRVGFFVTVKNGLLYKANEDDYISGITSGNPSIVGNADEDYYWRYERDEFNRIIREDVPELAQKLDVDGNPIFDEETNEAVMEETGTIIKNGKMKLSDNYDPTMQDSYVERKDRKEWDYVGMIGVLPVRDDGTCVAGQFCKCGQNGIATLAPERGFDTFFVIERISDNVVSVELR